MKDEYDTSHRKWWNPPGKVYWKSEWRNFIIIFLNCIAVLLLDIFLLRDQNVIHPSRYAIIGLIGWGLAILEEVIWEKCKARKAKKEKLD